MLPLARSANLALLFVLAFLVWLLNHAYQGVWHDAFVYGLLAAHWLHPAALAGDLFFSFGSQGAFSLFAPLYGELVGWLGLDLAAWWVTLVGGLLWVAACLALARTMLGFGLAARFAVFLGAVAVMSYSPNGSIFVLGENFATARSFAIPLGLASVAALAAKRPAWSLGFGLATFALHPLQGIWSLALWLLARLRSELAVTLALLPVAAVILLGVMNIDLPYLRLMTGDWLEFVRTSAPDVVFKAPPQTRLPEYSGVLMVLWLGARMGSEAWRALYLRLLLVGVGGLGMALVASYAFPVEVVIQGQAWRVMALLIPLAAVAMLDLAQRAWQSSVAGRLLVAFVAVLAGLKLNWLSGALCAIAVASLMPLAWIGQIEAWASRWRYWLVGALVAVGLSTVPNILAAWEISGGQLLNPWWTGAEVLHGLVAGNSWYLALLLALIPRWAGYDEPEAEGRSRLSVPCAVLGLGAAGLSLAVALHSWDRRSAEYRSEQACYLDKHCVPHPFRQWIAPGSTVFWPQREVRVWFLIGTASYFGQYQSIGRVFSAAKHYELLRRQSWIAVDADPRRLCGDPIIDWVVLTQPEPGLVPLASLRYAHLYSCAGLRALAPASTISRAAT